MKFLKTINVWDEGVQQAIRNGQLKLQRGQWMTCGKGNPKKCRYVGHSKHSIDAVHWQGSHEATDSLFMSRVNSYHNGKRLRKKIKQGLEDAKARL
jgi:hypothetical protein